jgi:hypothetical protein
LQKEVKEQREFVFAVVTKGDAPGEPERESVFACANEESFDRWLKLADQQCYLTQYAEKNELSMDTDGNFLNPDSGEMVISREDVLKAAEAELSGGESSGGEEERKEGAHVRGNEGGRT